MRTLLENAVVRAAAVVAIVAMVLPAPLAAAGLAASTTSAWDTYVAVTEGRRVGEERAGAPFLVMDFQAAGGHERRAVMAGQMVVRPMPASRDRGVPVDVPAALVHHWRGAVFLPHLTVSALMARLEHADPPVVQDDVLRAVVLSKSPGSSRVFLRLRRQKIVTVVYNTEHVVTFARQSPARASSSSVAARIAEVRSPGTPDERELVPGEDRGFLWRLNAYWRYEQVPGGVIAECESISLSRDVPFGFRTIVSPLIASAARESMEQALSALRARFASGV